MAYKYLSHYLKYKDKSDIVAYGNNKHVKQNNTIWIYWKQGIDNAPDIVKKCIESAKCHSGNHDVVVLDQNSISDYIILPDFIIQKHNAGIIQEALFSDLLRISLLIEYGGVWCDATCFWTAELPQVIEASDFFMFAESQMSGNITPIVCSNWFIKSNVNHAFLIKLRNCLFHYWESHHFTAHYFIFHLLLSLLVRSDSNCNKCWYKMPYYCNMEPHLLQFHFSDTYNSLMYNHFLDSCFVQKLTYKFDKTLVSENQNNMISYFMNH